MVFRNSEIWRVRLEILVSLVVVASLIAVIYELRQTQSTISGVLGNKEINEMSKALARFSKMTRQAATAKQARTIANNRTAQSRQAELAIIYPFVASLLDTSAGRQFHVKSGVS